jgi:predicted ester cyclase
MDIEQTRAVMAAYWDGDWDVVAEGVEVAMLASGEVTQGREAFRALRNHFYHGVFEAELEDLRTCVDAGRAVMEGTLTGVLQEPFAGIAPNGKTVRLPMCVSYDLADGRIVRLRIYVQTEGLRPA